MKATKTIIEKDDVIRSSTLTKKDIGKHAVISNGCWFIKNTEKEADALLKLLNEGL